MVQENRSLRTLASVLGAALLLGGCSILSPRPTAPSTAPPGSQPTGSASRSPLPPPAPPAPPAALPPPPRELAPTRENHLSPATRSLVTQARTLMSRGDLIGASSTLDRALRIEPNNPLLWIERGRLRLAESDAHQAEGCGRKALSLASGDRGTQAQAGRLLADALRAQRRNQEANEVERQPFMR
jgi:hypothetical protein